MRVHVVAERLHADRILPRLARYLATVNGWSLGEAPDSRADVNYFCNYITWRQHHNGWHDTFTSAFFTHRDSLVALKAKYWDDAARGIDQAVLCARIWAKHIPAGKVVYARPPVEVDRFVIAPETRGAQPVIGFSGFVYPDGRKGEGMAQKLVGSKLGQQCTFKASGRGWPVPTKAYSWADMPRFYQSLNVLAIVASNEGIPMPPLEALACGIKVVVPTECGMLDDLPDVPGIYRYRNGNVDELIRTVQRAAFDEGSVDRDALRKIITDDYTVENWCADHVSVITRGLAQSRGIQPELSSMPLRPSNENLPPWRGHAGIYCVAFGEPSRKCAKTLIQSVRRHMPGLPVCLVAASPLGVEDITVQHPDTDVGGRIAKLKAYELAPQSWQYVLYLDADTELVQPVDFLFDLLADGWEAAICRDMTRYATADQMVRPDNRDEAEFTWSAILSAEGTFQYNGGMMAFRRCAATERFFRAWRQEWDRYGKRDQGALLRALHANPLKLYVLMNHWNASDRYDAPRGGPVAIWHHNTQARRWVGLIRGRIDSSEAWTAVRDWEAGKVR